MNVLSLRGLRIVLLPPLITKRIGQMAEKGRSVIYKVGGMYTSEKSGSGLFFFFFLLGSSGRGTAIELRGNSRNLGLQVLVGRVDFVFVLDQEGAEDAGVDKSSTLRS